MRPCPTAISASAIVISNALFTGTAPCVVPQPSGMRAGRERWTDVRDWRPAGRPRVSEGVGRCAGGVGWRSAFPGWSGITPCAADGARAEKRDVECDFRGRGELQRRGLDAIVLLDEQCAVRVMICIDGIMPVGMARRTFMMVRRQARSERAEQHDQAGRYRRAEDRGGSHGPDDAEQARDRQRERPAQWCGWRTACAACRTARSRCSAWPLTYTPASVRALRYARQAGREDRGRRPTR